MSRREEPRYRDHDEWSDEMYRRKQEEQTRDHMIREFKWNVRNNAALSQQMELTDVVKCITGTDDEVWDILIKYAKKDTDEQKAGNIEMVPAKKRSRAKKKKP